VELRPQRPCTCFYALTCLPVCRLRFSAQEPLSASARHNTGHYQIVSKLGVRALSVDDPARMLGTARARGLRFILGQSSPPFWGCGLK